MNKLLYALFSFCILNVGNQVYAEDAMSKDSMGKDSMGKDLMGKDLMGKGM
jgi:pentapeptide MXKDX repeat protein